MNGARLGVAALVLGLAPGLGPAGGEPAAPITLKALMKGMAGASGVVAEFREVKEVALLEAPLESHGMLYFVPPDRLARHTTRPGESWLVIDGTRFRFRDEAGEDDIDLSGNPVARGFVDNMIVLFNGDLAELQRRYRCEFRAEGERWELVLKPRQAPVKDLIESIRMRGAGRALREMRVAEMDGDRTTTTFDDVETDHRFEAEELTRLFGLRGDSPSP